MHRPAVGVQSDRSAKSGQVTGGIIAHDITGDINVKRRFGLISPVMRNQFILPRERHSCINTALNDARSKRAASADHVPIQARSRILRMPRSIRVQALRVETGP